MVISLPMILLIILIVLALGGSGYGYYSGGGYASPLGVLGALLIIALIVGLVMGGGVILTRPA